MQKLPETPEQWEKIKKEFIKKFRVEDTPETWTFLLSQLQNTKMPELEFDYTIVHNHYKRYKIAKLLQDEKQVYLKALQDKLEQKVKAFNEQQGLVNEGTSPQSGNDVSIGSHDIERVMSGLPETEAGLVQPHS